MLSPEKPSITRNVYILCQSYKALTRTESHNGKEKQSSIQPSKLVEVQEIRTSTNRDEEVKPEGSIRMRLNQDGWEVWTHP